MKKKEFFSRTLKTNTTQMKIMKQITATFFQIKKNQMKKIKTKMKKIGDMDYF